jgi:hypothetical protein
LPKVFSALGPLIIPPAPFKKGGNCKELQEKSSFKKGDLGGFENLHGKEFMANAITTRMAVG